MGLHGVVAGVVVVRPCRVPELIGFPSNLPDDKLDGIVEGLVAAMRGRFGARVDTWLPELQLALLTVAISEQSRRQLARASRVATIGLLIAGAALFVALVTLFVQLAWRALRNDWRNALSGFEARAECHHGTAILGLGDFLDDPVVAVPLQHVAYLGRFVA